MKFGPGCGTRNTGRSASTTPRSCSRISWKLREQQQQDDLRAPLAQRHTPPLKISPELARQSLPQPPPPPLPPVGFHPPRRFLIRGCVPLAAGCIPGHASLHLWGRMRLASVKPRFGFGLPILQELDPATPRPALSCRFPRWSPASAHGHAPAVHRLSSASTTTTPAPAASLESIGLAQWLPGEVVIRVAWSPAGEELQGYALAGTGKGRILRHFPLVGGIDVARASVCLDRPHLPRRRRRAGHRLRPSE